MIFRLASAMNLDKDMICQARLLAASKDGKIFLCSGCGTRITLLFGNICQCFELNDYKVFELDLMRLDIDAYFYTYKYETRIYVNTKMKDFFYSFSREEMGELQNLLADAHLKIMLIGNTIKNLN